MKLDVKIFVCVVVVVAPATGVVVVVALIGGVSLDCLLKLRPEFRIFCVALFTKLHLLESEKYKHKGQMPS